MRGEREIKNYDEVFPYVALFIIAAVRLDLGLLVKYSSRNTLMYLSSDAPHAREKILFIFQKSESRAKSIPL